MINGKTGLTGLLGSPVDHSISPMMHNAAFQACHLNYVYLCFDVKESGLETAVDGLRMLGARGWNCTMPDKTCMARLCDELSPAAKIIGAVNTVVNDGGRLTGYSTDGTGFMKAVQEAGFSVIGEKVTLLGAGGAATAILVQAALDGVKEISVFCRPGASFERAKETIQKLCGQTSCRFGLFDYSDDSVLRRELSQSRMLINGTNVGMAPDTDRCLIPDPGMLTPELIVSDVIYNPRKTRLLSMAEEQGCRYFNGLYMLLYQGAEAFRLWTGQEMPVSLIRSRFFDEPEAQGRR